MCFSLLTRRGFDKIDLCMLRVEHDTVYDSDAKDERQQDEARVNGTKGHEA